MEYKVTAREFDFIVCDLNFTCIFGKHVNGGYVAIINWGVSAELSASDARYNSRKLLIALQNSPEKFWLPSDEGQQQQIARDLGQMITERIQEMK